MFRERQRGGPAKGVPVHHSSELRQMNQVPSHDEVISGTLNLRYWAISPGNRVDEKKGTVRIPCRITSGKKRAKPDHASIYQLPGVTSSTGRGVLRTLFGSCNGGPVASRRAIIQRVPITSLSGMPLETMIPVTTPSLQPPAAVDESKRISLLDLCVN